MWVNGCLCADSMTIYCMCARGGQALLFCLSEGGRTRKQITRKSAMKRLLYALSRCLYYGIALNVVWVDFMARLHPNNLGQLSIYIRYMWRLCAVRPCALPMSHEYRTRMHISESRLKRCLTKTTLADYHLVKWRSHCAALLMTVHVSDRV